MVAYGIEKAMTLTELLMTIKNDSKLVVTVLESDGTELVKFFASGYAQILSSLLEREIDELIITNNTAITVKLVDNKI